MIIGPTVELNLGLAYATSTLPFPDNNLIMKRLLPCKGYVLIIACCRYSIFCLIISIVQKWNVTTNTVYSRYSG
jgi:hypothetical protein